MVYLLHSAISTIYVIIFLFIQNNAISNKYVIMSLFLGHQLHRGAEGGIPQQKNQIFPLKNYYSMDVQIKKIKP